VRVGGLYGYLTPEEAWAVTPRFEAANPFADDGGAWVRFQGKYGRINIKGEWVVPIDYALVKDNIPALSWERVGDRRTLKAGRGTVVMSIEPACDREVAKNARGEIIWPEKDGVAEISEARP